MEVLDNEFMDHHYPSSVLENLKSLWLSKRLCDATLEAGPVKFYVHRLILIAMIPGLNQLQICTTGKPLEVVLPATIKAEALNTIVHYLYTGALHLTPQNASWVEQIIHLLGLVKLYPFCKQYQCYLKRKKMVTLAVELFKNPILVLSESEKAVQVHYLESEQQLGCLEGQLSISNFPSIIKNISVVKKEEFDDKIKGIETKNSELALNHSDFTLGTFLESSSKERLHFQICSNAKDGEIYDPNSSETTSIQRPLSESSTCTASETCMMNDLSSPNEENSIASVGKGTAIASLNDSKSETCEKDAEDVMLQHIKLEPVSEDEVKCGVDRGILLGKDKYIDGRQAVATQLNCQFTRQRLHTSNPDQPDDHNANGLSTMSQEEKEDFTIFCPLCLINFNSRKSYTDHQSVCFDTFHHNQLFRLMQNEKIHQFCNSVPRTSRVPYQSSTGGRVFSFVRHRTESATSSSTYTVPISPDREQTRHVQQIKTQTENNNCKEMENPVLEGNGGKSGMIEDNRYIPFSLNECASFTPKRMEEKLSTGSKKSLLSNLLRDDEVMEENRQTENCNEVLQSNDFENTMNHTLNGEKDADNLNLKITDVWTLKDVHEHAEPVPGDSQRKLLNKAEDQPEINKMKGRSKEAFKFFSLYDVETVGNKLYIKRKTTVGSQEGNQTCDQLKTRADKKSRERRKQVSAEANVHRNSSNVGMQEGGRAAKAAGEMADCNVLPENTEHKIRECFSSDGKSENEKIVITQTPIKKLTSIITAVSEGENKHLLKKKQGNCEDIKARGSSSTENKCSIPSKSNISNASSIQKDQQTERKVYEFRERTTNVINQQVRDYLGIRDEKTSNKGRPQHQIYQTSVCSPIVSGAGELLSSSKNEVLTKQGEPKMYNLVNTYSCKTNYPNVGPLNYYRKSTLQEKISRIHRENCIVIPKQWKDWKEENSNNVASEQLESKLIDVPPVVLKRVPNETDDLVNRNASCTSEVSRQYTVPLKKRKQY